ncbi:hypothetical protein, variant 1, partial [Aphanomyces astaci]
MFTPRRPTTSGKGASPSSDPRRPEQPRPSTTPNVSGWVASVSRENKDFARFAEYFQTQLEHAVRSSEHQGDPNGFRTSVCFELLDMVGQQFNRYDGLLRTIVRECENSVYVDPQHNHQHHRGARVPLKASDYFVRQPFFAELHVQQGAKQAVDDDIAALDDRHQFMMEQLAIKENVLDRTSQRWARTILLQAFRTWNRVTQAKHKVRMSMQKAMARWKKRHSTILLRAWRQAVVSEKQIAARRRLSALTDNAGDCKESQLRLEGSIMQLRDDIASLKGSIETQTTTQERLHHTFAALKEEIWHSQERQLQSLCNEWGRLCLTLVDAELTYLSYMLATVNLSDYCEPTMMLRPREDKLELLRAPEDVIVLRWASCMFHRHLVYNDVRLGTKAKAAPMTSKSSPASAAAAAAASSDAEFSRVQNFTSDLKGMYVLGSILRVIHRTQPLDQHSNVNSNNDDMVKEWTTDKVLHYLRVLRCPDYLVQHLELHLDNPSADIMYCVLSYLCCEFTCMVPAACPWQEALQSLQDAKTAWDSVRKGWSELETPFDVTKLDHFQPDTTHVSVVAMAKEALQNAVQMVQYACAARAANMQLWTCVQKRVHLKAIDTMLHRARMGLPFQMTNRREARERAMYTKVDMVKLARILDMDVAGEMPKLETLFSDQYEDVQRIFKYYAASDVGDACSMSLDEFHRFLKDCKLVTKSLGLAYVKKIFNEINQVEDKSVQCDIDDDDDDEENEVELEFGPTEFVEAIVCVADKRLGSHKGLSLSQRVKKCLVEYILANACRSSTDAFRHQMNAIECKAVFQTYQTKLEQIYRRYAAQSSSLNGQGFVALLEAYDLFTDVLTVGDVKHVLKKIQQESDDAPESGAAVTTDVDLELTFTEFCEVHDLYDDEMIMLIRP